MRRRKEEIETFVAMFMSELDTINRHARRTVDAAWRHAVEMWLLQENIIAVSQRSSLWTMMHRETQKRREG